MIPGCGEVDVGPPTSRMRLLLVSAIKISPLASTATPWGLLNLAAVATWPSPEKPAVPLPATVMMFSA